MGAAQPRQTALSVVGSEDGRAERDRGVLWDATKPQAQSEGRKRGRRWFVSHRK